jgi:hypothetical protein
MFGKFGNLVVDEPYFDGQVGIHGILAILIEQDIALNFQLFPNSLFTDY